MERNEKHSESSSGDRRVLYFTPVYSKEKAGRRDKVLDLYL